MAKSPQNANFETTPPGGTSRRKPQTALKMDERDICLN